MALVLIVEQQLRTGEVQIMKELEAKKPDYGNWVSKRLVYVPGLTGTLLRISSIVFLTIYASAVTPLLVDFSFVSLMFVVGAASVMAISLPFTLLSDNDCD